MSQFHRDVYDALSAETKVRLGGNNDDTAIPLLLLPPPSRARAFPPALSLTGQELWERLPPEFRKTVEQCLISDAARRPSVSSLLAQPDVRELRNTHLHPFSSKSEDEDERPGPLRPATVPSAMFASSSLYKGSPVTEIDSSECPYAPAPPRATSPTRFDCVENGATASSLVSALSAFSAESTDVETSRMDFYPSSFSHLLLQQQRRLLAKAKEDAVGAADPAGGADAVDATDGQESADNGARDIGADRPQREQAMVNWLRTHCPYICPENVPIYAKMFYDDNASAIERVARRACKRPSWMGSELEIHEDDEEKILEALEAAGYLTSAQVDAIFASRAAAASTSQAASPMRSAMHSPAHTSSTAPPPSSSSSAPSSSSAASSSSVGTAVGPRTTSSSVYSTPSPSRRNRRRTSATDHRASVGLSENASPIPTRKPSLTGAWFPSLEPPPGGARPGLSLWLQRAPAWLHAPLHRLSTYLPTHLATAHAVAVAAVVTAVLVVIFSGRGGDTAGYPPSPPFLDESELEPDAGQWPVGPSPFGVSGRGGVCTAFGEDGACKVFEVPSDPLGITSLPRRLGKQVVGLFFPQFG